MKSGDVVRLPDHDAWWKYGVVERSIAKGKGIEVWCPGTGNSGLLLTFENEDVTFKGRLVLGKAYSAKVGGRRFRNVDLVLPSDDEPKRFPLTVVTRYEQHDPDETRTPELRRLAMAQLRRELT